MEVYLDNSATTKVYGGVSPGLLRRIMSEDYGNPSSMHQKGVDAEVYVKEAKERIAKILKVQEKEIFFTSGGTESDNWALMGAASANSRAGRHLITTKIEHPAILQTMEYLESIGYEVTYLPVDEKGVLRLDALEQAIRPDTILVSIMHVNNEVGAIQPMGRGRCTDQTHESAYAVPCRCGAGLWQASYLSKEKSCRYAFGEWT